MKTAKKTAKHVTIAAARKAFAHTKKATPATAGKKIVGRRGPKSPAGSGRMCPTIRAAQASVAKKSPHPSKRGRDVVSYMSDRSQWRFDGRKGVTTSAAYAGTGGVELIQVRFAGDNHSLAVDVKNLRVVK